MAKLIEIEANTFLNPDMVMSIDPQGSKCLVTLVSGKIMTVPLDAQTLAKSVWPDERRDSASAEVWRPPVNVLEGWGAL